LKEKGILDIYYQILEETITEYARKTKEEILKINPELIFGFYQLNLPVNWFSKGIMRGFSTEDRPSLLFTFETAGKSYLEMLRKEDIFLLHSTVFLLGMTEDYSRIIENSINLNHGYWINRITWLVENPSTPHGVEIPYNKTQSEAISELKKANENLDKLLNFNK